MSKHRDVCLGNGRTSFEKERALMERCDWCGTLLSCDNCGHHQRRWKHGAETLCDDCHLNREEDTTKCRDCGAPFNNANPSRSGLCAACEG